MDITDDVDLLLAVLPPHLREAIETKDHRTLLLEVVLDLGRLPEARYPEHIENLSSRPITAEDISYVVTRLGPFASDNRAGIERTLHRISAIRNRVGTIVGLTCRVGRAIFGTVDILRNVIEKGASILLLGRPGVGKTTLLREAARVLADDLEKRVIVVDTSNEIGGDGDIPHPGIGRARRMQVPSPDRQHAVMIEAVENHMPEVIVIDEIGTEAEARAARTIAERGVQLIATAHGVSMENILQNPTLSDLVGGIHAVTLSDDEARRRRTQKTVLERKAPPTFDVLVEIQDKDRLAIHHSVAEVVDAFLRGRPARPEIRMRTGDGGVEVVQQEEAAEPVRPTPDGTVPKDESIPLVKWSGHKVMRIFTYGVSRGRLQKAIHKYQVPARLVEDIERADILLTLKSQEKRQPKRLLEAQDRGMPLHVVKSNSMTQLENFLRAMFEIEERQDGEESAMEEAEAAIGEVFEKGLPVELSPQNSRIRRLQHQLAERYNLITRSSGKEPYRCVVIYPE